MTWRSALRKVKAHKERRKKGPTAKRRAAKRRKLDRLELEQMREARARDGQCRFPVCGCRLRGGITFAPEVSHAKHRGMGGNPSGDRTTTAGLLLLCNWRHKLAKFSIDRKTLRWVPLTDAGADGPIKWQIDLSVVRASLPMQIAIGVFLTWPADDWMDLAIETAPHRYAPFSEAQAAILAWLAGMEC